MNLVEIGPRKVFGARLVLEARMVDDLFADSRSIVLLVRICVGMPLVEVRK